jgi:hypothetical protein
MTPSRFRAEVRRFDKRLDFRFNGRKQQWEIVGVDARNQKYLIAKFKLGELDHLGLDILRDMAEVSPIKSSAKEVNQRIDRLIEDDEKRQARHLQSNISDRLDEAWSHYQYAEGARVSFANIGDNSKNEKVTITDRRRIIDDGKGE